jgi:CRISPR-associated protein (TIGR02584 family)
MIDSSLAASALNPGRPASYPRRALVCVLGTSPSVVTETLYALITSAEPDRFVPTELHLVTTGIGRARAEPLLVGPGGALAGLIEEQIPHGTVDPLLRQVHWHVVQLDGQELDDVHTAEQHKAMGDTVYGLLQRLARDPGLAIHGSIAGGRKSMGFYLGYALSIVGRPQDRLSHVLVNRPFESLPEFFYPPRVPIELVLPDGSRIRSDAATITLAPVPFVPMGQGLAAGEARSFREAVEDVQRGLLRHQLIVDPRMCEIRYGELTLKLPPREALWMTFFALLREEAGSGDGLVTRPEGMAGAQATMDRACRFANVDRLDICNVAKDYFSEVKSLINKAITKQWGAALADRLKLGGVSVGKGGGKALRHGLTGLAPSEVRVIYPRTD